MKKLKPFILFLFFCTIGFTSQAQVAYGAGTSLNLDSRVYIGLFGRAQFPITSEIAGAVEFTYWLSNFANFSINANGYYKLSTIGDHITLSPMAGLNFTSFSSNGLSDFLKNTTLQIGALFEISLYGMIIGVEPKLIFHSKSGLVISAFVTFGGN